MKSKIIAKNKKHLKVLIKQEIELHGYQCDLNHIDVSQVTDMSALFSTSSFNGDISKWDVSNVKNMSQMFYDSDYLGDISNWNVSGVEDMSHMFGKSVFNGDISKWNVSNVGDMYCMFSYSKFSGDISNWKPYCLVFCTSKILGLPDNLIPYWSEFEDQEDRNRAIDSYYLQKKLGQELIENNTHNKKLKI
jgi:surface protein